ncbi:hypothetical protein SAMN05444156_2020 [Verrucomicrobium sp. GAS474]|uniref:hypothetical protein n=1 Tax=Verrucomicrobium sp. GAS474 TaxID=1882831 RepID=UPI00087BEF76|nr:hypothetical protein [Verrucomicrobium sp. GAS474]SDU11141.1 hypothetical protein SAMN05444156_2020 [Verrucomicrobium sp. GAS474]
MKVSLLAQTLSYIRGGGHFWVYLNWALGLRACGCEVRWIETVDPKTTDEALDAQVAHLCAFLRPYGFDQSILLAPLDGREIPPSLASVALTPDRAAESDLLLNFRYGLPVAVLSLFRRTALIDIDPGLLQVWVAGGQMHLPPHDLYFTTGENLGAPGTIAPDLGLRWHSIHPCVALELWNVAPAASAQTPYTTVSHWQAHEYVIEPSGHWYDNSKRAGFLPYLDLPKKTAHPLQLALCLSDTDPSDIADRATLLANGWQLSHSYDVAGTPADYHRYIQGSYGEFSAAKPSCARFGLAWISDRSLCYLASGKPVVVSHSGPSAYLPDSGGLWRVRDADEAARAIEAIAADYPRQCALARELAETHFDARKIAARVLEIAAA